MVLVYLIRPGFTREIILLYFNPHYQFYFTDKQHEDEVCIFKQFDWKSDVA